MAAEDASNIVVRDPEIRLSQFLYVGKEYADYHPGNWFVHDYFRAVNIMSILELAENPKKQLVPIELITKVSVSAQIAQYTTKVLSQMFLRGKGVCRRLIVVLSHVRKPWYLLSPYAADNFKAKNYVMLRTKVWKRSVHRSSTSCCLSSLLPN